MDTRAHGVLVNAAGFLYATLGFSLSVLAALISAIYPSKVQDVASIPFHTRAILPNPPRGRRPVRAFSDQMVKDEKQPALPPALVEDVQQVSSEKIMRRSVSAHELRHSKSMVPVITIDYFGSADSPRRAFAGTVMIDSPRITNPITRLPEHTPFVNSPPSSPPAAISSLPPTPSGTATSSVPSSPPATISSVSSDASCKSDRHGFRLFHIKQWGKDKPKSTPSLLRRQSSPQLCPRRMMGHKHTNSDGILPTSAKSEPKPKSRKTLRKMQSVPVHEKVPSTASPRKSEKKRSQTLRTDPYDAPYFAPPPVPPLPAYKPQTREDTIRQLRDDPNPSPGRTLEKKPSKSQLGKN